jgi:hypothetical protein
VKEIDLLQVSQKTKRVERHWICGEVHDLEVFRVPTDRLYFNIENGRYADRMMRLKSENPGKQIDPRDEKWKNEIERMLAGEHRDTARDKAAFARLKEDIAARQQLRPGVVLPDGGVIDGNRRLAAFRRLAKEAKNPSPFRFFDAVILPDNTTPEDRWRIEAGLQLGINERWDYSPVNELLKVREGLKMYERMIRDGTVPAGQTTAELVSKAIYGRSESNIIEMASRLDLIDDYLRFIERPGAYDEIGESSEDFLEARKIITAAENRQYDLKFLAKLKAVLFFVIHREIMNNYDLRDIYDALGGDPRKKGRKKVQNPEVLAEFLADYPDDPREMRADLLRPKAPAPTPTSKGGSPPTKPGTASHGRKAPTPPPPVKGIDLGKIKAGKERFARKMEAASKSKSARQFASAALAEMQNLEKSLHEKNAVGSLSNEDQDAILTALRSTQKSLKNCLAVLE